LKGADDAPLPTPMPAAVMMRPLILKIVTGPLQKAVLTG
jgi:hypothetical protein